MNQRHPPDPGGTSHAETLHGRTILASGTQRGESQPLPTDVAPRPPFTVTPHALIVDDDQSIRFVLRTALRGQGWSVDEADDGASVEEQLETRRYELVILDLYMPGMNGFEVLRRIRQPHAGVRPLWRTSAEVGIVVLSGAAGEDGLGFASRLGADVCLKKPFEVDDVLRAVRAIRASRRE
jgi:two-component system OmpR family response regulator